MISKPFRMGVFAFGSSLLLALIGCDRGGEPPVNTDDAERQLRIALDAWKAKEPFANLATRQPAIYFNEPLWKEGAQLIDYEMGTVELFGRQGRCTVKMSLLAGDGKRVDRRIGYQIDTKPTVVITREGLGN